MISNNLAVKNNAAILATSTVEVQTSIAWKNTAGRVALFALGVLAFISLAVLPGEMVFPMAVALLIVCAIVSESRGSTLHHHVPQHCNDSCSRVDEHIYIHDHVDKHVHVHDYNSTPTYVPSSSRSTYPIHVESPNTPHPAVSRISTPNRAPFSDSSSASSFSQSRVEVGSGRQTPGAASFSSGTRTPVGAGNATNHRG